MNVSLNPELERLVQEKVASGLYASASEVVRDALRLLNERDQVRQIQLEEVRKRIAEGLAELDAGELLDGPKVLEELLRKARARAEARSA